MKIDVKVTQEHIDRGERDRCFKCPVALALRDVPGIHRAAVGTTTFTIVKRGIIANETPLPADVQERVKLFDETGNMKPFQFSIEVPDAA